MAKKYFHLPEEIPGGFWDVLQPLAKWILQALKEAYQNGYYAGKADAGQTWMSILDKKQTSGAAVVT